MTKKIEFPIQDQKAKPVNWATAEQAYADYARRFGKEQSLERIAERGGFGQSEMIEFLDNRARLLANVYELACDLLVTAQRLDSTNYRVDSSVLTALKRSTEDVRGT